MSSLTHFEGVRFEKFFGMESGYVCDFSDKTFDVFILESVGINVRTSDYAVNGSSKANRLRTLWKRETDPVVAKLLNEMLLYWREARGGVKKFDQDDQEHFQQCLKVVERLAGGNATGIKDVSLVSGPSSQFGIHPDIAAKCSSLYEAKHFAEAVEKSFKVVRDRLRKLTGHETGSEAFGKGKLHIRGAAASNVESDFNQAAKFLMMAIDMFRNEKSHTSDARIEDPVRAHQYLAMSSLALSLLDDTEIKS